jgi:iron-sulfur cluster repair protein YtfE (RIC family)
MLHSELTANTKRLDLSVADPTGSAEGAAGLALSAFDGLAVGDTLLLRSAADLRPLYERLCAQRTALFRWTLLEREEGKEQALITRLQPKDREAMVGAYFERDHEEIDVLLEYTRRDLEGAAAPAAAPPATLLPYFREFKRRLERHIRWEEELLFPAVESGAPQLAFGPGRVMRWEHQEIHRVMTRLEEELRTAESVGRITGQAREILEELTAILAAHNMKEEAVYYPLADRRLSPEETRRLLSKVMFPEGRGEKQGGDPGRSIPVRV